MNLGWQMRRAGPGRSGMAWRRWALLAWVCTVLAACGGGGSDNSPPPEVAPPVQERAGRLESATFLGTLALADIAEAVTQYPGLHADLAPRYAVQAYRLEYLTSDADGREVRASGLVGVPVKAAGARSPVLSYQHGTIFSNADAPSQNAVPSEVAVVLASLGYLVVAPDYVGFGASQGQPHPYLLAEPSALATVDLLTAARTWREQALVADNQQLFLTGYSEGGYVTLAAHRAIEQRNLTHRAQLRMVVPGAGPYDVQATMDGLLDIVRDEYPLLGGLINPGFLSQLGGSVQREVRRALVRALIPGEADVAYDTRFIDWYLADDTRLIAEYASVYDWVPTVPVRFFHGRDDRTVPYASSANTVRTMQRRGAGRDLVELTDCRATPSGHSQCVEPFILHLQSQLRTVAQDL